METDRDQLVLRMVSHFEMGDKLAVEFLYIQEWHQLLKLNDYFTP